MGFGFAAQITMPMPISKTALNGPICRAKKFLKLVSSLIRIKQAKPVVISITAVFGMLPIVISEYGICDNLSAIVYAWLYIVCAISNGVCMPTNAHIVPIITSGIMIKENIGRNIILPIMP